MATLFSKNYVFCKFLLFLQVNGQINAKKHFFGDVILKVTLYLKFQVDTIKTDISYLHSKNINIMNREYTIKKFTEKPRQDYRSSYRYIKPHPLTRYRKQSSITKKTNIENTN